IMELSRGHSESRMKSERNGAAWAEKKRRARCGEPQRPTERMGEGSHFLTRCLPAWVEEQNSQLKLVPKRAAVVKRIFQLAAHGYGRKLIAGKLIQDGVPPMTSVGHWNGSYVGAILADRRAVGELQPKQKHGRKKDGPPIPDYYPAAVSEEEWLAAQAGVAQPRKNPGRTGAGDFVNIFAGLLKDALGNNGSGGGDSYRSAPRMPAHGRGDKGRVLVNQAAMEGRDKCRSFPLATFEDAVLSALREIDPHEILNGNNGPDESLVLAGELARVESKIGELAAAPL